MKSDCVDIEIKPDGILEIDENFRVALTTNDSSANLVPQETEITITDGGGMPGCRYYLILLAYQFNFLFSSLTHVIWSNEKVAQSQVAIP